MTIAQLLALAVLILTSLVEIVRLILKLVDLLSRPAPQKGVKQ